MKRIKMMKPEDIPTMKVMQFSNGSYIDVETGELASEEQIRGFHARRLAVEKALSYRWARRETARKVWWESNRKVLRKWGISKKSLEMETITSTKQLDKRVVEMLVEEMMDGYGYELNDLAVQELSEKIAKDFPMYYDRVMRGFRREIRARGG